MKKTTMNAKIQSDGYIEMFAVLGMIDLGHDMMPKIVAMFGTKKEAYDFLGENKQLNNTCIQKINLGNIVVPSIDELSSLYQS